MQTIYRPGEWYLLVMPGALVALPPDIPSRVVAQLWERMPEQKTLATVIDVLTSNAEGSFAALPPFAAAVAEGTDVRIALRGGVAARVTTDAGSRSLSGSEVTTWSEQFVRGATRVEITVEPTDGNAALPVQSGVVRVAAVSADLETGDDAHPVGSIGPVPVIEAGTAAALSATDLLRTPAPVLADFGHGADEVAKKDGASGGMADRVSFSAQEPDAGIAPEPGLDPESRVASGPALDLEGEHESEPAIESEPDPEIGIETDPAIVPESESVPESAPEPPIEAESELQPEPGSAPDPEPEPELGGEARPNPDLDPDPTPNVDGVTMVPIDVTLAPDAQAPSDDSWGDTVYTAPPAVSPAIGDHDGSTISAADLQQLRQKTPVDPDASTVALPVVAASAGRIRVSTGQIVDLDRTVIIGRRPRSPRASGANLPHLIAVDSPQQDISRSHLEIRPEGDTVVVVDLHTTNGSTLIRTGADPMRLHPGEQTLVLSGDVVDLGDGVTVAFEGLP